MRSSRDHDLDGLSGLAEAAQSGDRAALGTLSRELQQPVYRLALRFCGHPIDAADVALEVMLRLLTTLETYDGRPRFTVWVYANAVRQLQRCEPRSVEAATDQVSMRTPGALVGLPRDQRVAYVLTDLLGFTLAEGAQICATDPASYRRLLAAARSARRGPRTPSAGPFDTDPADVAAPDSVWSRLVATMPSQLGNAVTTERRRPDGGAVRTG